MKRGIIFSLDAAFALFLLLVILPVLYLVSTNFLSPSVLNSNLQSVSRDSVNLLAETRISDVRTDSYVVQLFASGVLDSSDENKSLMELIGSFWATGDPGNLSIAQNLSSRFLSKVVPSGFNWALYYSTDDVFNTTSVPSDSSIALSRRLVSGVAKGLPATGCISRASLKKIGGKNEKSFYFLGGFVGQGNLSILLSGLPLEAVIRNLYLEFNAGDNFTLTVNSQSCGLFNKTPGNYSVDSWSVNAPSCLNAFVPGANNLLAINFTGSDLSAKYIGGGFIKVTYDTTLLNPGSQNYSRVFLAGVNGLVNQYSSFYVPGQLTNISASLHLRNNFTTFLTIGNKTIFNDSGGSIADRVIFVSPSNFTSAYSLSELSSKTIPFRLAVEANITGGNIGNADIIIVTDISGSMAWNVNQDSVTGQTVLNCSSPNLLFGNTSRVSVARCVDKSFIDTILNTSGNKIGLVSFSTSFVNSSNLTTDATALKSQVDTYAAAGSTCVSCGINKAYEILSQWPSTGRNRFVVMMTDGVPNQRSTPVCYDANALASNTSFTAHVDAAGAIVHYNPFWTAVSSPTATDLKGVDVLNSSLGFASGTAGKIFKWNGVSWVLNQTMGSQDLYGVDIYNSTLAFVVGDTGRIFRWLGGAWSSQVNVTGTNLRDVKVYNSTLAFTVGSAGRIFRWNGVSWTSYQNVSNGIDLYSVDVFNATLAFAVGSSGKIYRWNGVTWTEQQDLGSMIVTDVHIFNSTLAFATTDDSHVYRWTGAAWSSVYTGIYALNTVRVINSTLGFALGDSREGVIQWNGATWTQTFPAYLYNGNSTTGLLCNDNDACSLTQSIPMLNSNYSSCRVHDEQNSTVFAVGFGPVTTCGFANTTLQAVASCGNGSVYLSSNSTDLQFAFQNIASKIIQQSTTSQSVFSSGNISTELYADSYFDFTYNGTAPAYGFNEILLSQETNKFPSCSGSFFVPSPLTVDSVKATSYSSALWTSNVSLFNSLGQNRVFFLGDYGSSYTKLGDPFLVEFPPSAVKTGENNLINIKLAANSSFESASCSQDNRVIYGLRLKAVVGYSSIFQECKARNATIYYDSDFDGVPDGAVNVSVGQGLPSAGSAFVTVDNFNTTTNAVDDALARLLSLLNLVNASGSGLAGSATNPIDVQLSDSVSAEVLSGQQVPFFWGPTEVTVLVWK